MRDEEYDEWERYLRLIEFTYNTTLHTTVGHAPFTIAHGMPARTVVASIADDDLCTSNESGITTREVQLIQQSAQAFAQEAAQMREQQQRASAERMRAGGNKAKYEVGDLVTFYIPPTADQAQRRGRKLKHLMWYRGPAKVEEVLSGTTYRISYQGTSYFRATSELRPYKAAKGPVPSKGHTTSQGTSRNQKTSSHTPLEVSVGVYVAYRTHQDDRRYHIGRVAALLEGELQVHTHATVSNGIRHAVWKPVYSTNKGEYTTEPPRGRARAGQDSKLYDYVPNQPEDKLVLCEVALTNQKKLSQADQGKLRARALQHHQLGHSWP